MCATTTCAPAITATVGGLTPTMGLVVQLLAAVSGLFATPPVTHSKNKEAIDSKLLVVLETTVAFI